MKTKHIVALCTLSFCMSITLMSCDALLNPGSVFSEWDKPDLAKISGLTGSALLSALDNQDGSNKFYDSLTPAQEATIATNLTALEGSSDPAIKSAAALAHVELVVKTNPLISDTINNIAEIFLDDTPVPSGTTEIANIITKLTAAILPIASDEAALATFLTDMSTISNSYALVGPGSDVEPGDLQTFIVAAVFGTIVDVFNTATPSVPIPDVAHRVSVFLADTSQPLDSSLFAAPTPITESSLQDLFDSTSENITTLTNLANYAGLEALGTKITDAIGAP